jgi:hypothetical protein
MVAIEDELSKHSHKTYFEHTIKSWEFYCKKHDIDFYVVREKLPNVKYSVWHKEFVFDFVGDKYEKIGVVEGLILSRMMLVMFFIAALPTMHVIGWVALNVFYAFVVAHNVKQLMGD